MDVIITGCYDTYTRTVQVICSASVRHSSNSCAPLADLVDHGLMSSSRAVSGQLGYPMQYVGMQTRHQASEQILVEKIVIRSERNRPSELAWM